METMTSVKDLLIENGIKVHIKGVEYDLNEIDPDELAKMMDELTDEEAEAVAKEVQDQLGVDDLAQLVAEVEEEERSLRGEAPQPKEDNSKASINLDPIILAVPDDGCVTHDLVEFQEGIAQASYIAGQFTALINAGLSDKQAFDLIMTQLKHAQDVEMFEHQAVAQKELEAQKIKLQLQIQGLKHVLEED